MRILFSLEVMIYHLADFFPFREGAVRFALGYSAVEFFFIVSGYLVAKSADGYNSQYQTASDPHYSMRATWYVGRKFVSVFPYWLLASLTSLTAYLVICGGQGTPDGFSYPQPWFLLAEVFGLQMYGFDGFWATGTGWYLSALLICTLVLYSLWTSRWEKSIGIGEKLAFVLFCYGYVLRFSPAHSLDSIIDSNPIMVGLFRAMAALQLGQLAFLLRKHWLIKLPKTAGTRFWLSLVQLFGYGIPLAYGIFGTIPGAADFFLPFCLTIAVAASFSCQSARSHTAINLLGKATISLYLNHYYWFQILYHARLEELSSPLVLQQTCKEALLLIAVSTILNFVLGQRLERYFARWHESIIKIYQTPSSESH